MREIRFFVNEDLYKEFKILCVKNDLSLPKQTHELIRKFVEIQNQNEIRLQHIRK